MDYIYWTRVDRSYYGFNFVFGFRIIGMNFFQNASRKRKSIFMRLVENDKRKTISRELTPTHDSHGRRIRQRSICTPKKIQNIQEEPDKSTSNAHLTAVPSQHRPKSSKHASIDTPEQTKSATSKQSRPKIAETPKSGEQKFIILDIVSSLSSSPC